MAQSKPVAAVLPYQDLALPFMIAGNLGAVAGNYFFYHMQSKDDVKDLTEPEKLAYTVKRSGPAFLITWLILEIQAVSRISTGTQAWQNLEGSDILAPPIAAIINRIQTNSVEQALMTFGTCLVVSQHCDGNSPVDVRIAPAMSWMYALGRILFGIGYAKSPFLRLPGLFMGNFWMNCSALLYCCLRSYGAKHSPTTLRNVVVGTPIGIISAVIALAVQAGQV